MTAKRLKERIGKAVFAAAAVICVIAVVAIFAYLIYKSIPAFGKLGVVRFMFGDYWSPDRLDTYDSPLSGTYGILTMIVGTLTATVGALLVGGVLGFFTAIFLAFYCPPAPRRVLSAVINLLAGIPSVVYGLVGMIVLVPLIRTTFSLGSGACLLAAILVLSIMVLPSIINVSETALRAVPREYEEASLALGATATETYFRVSLHAARSGVATAVVLGVGRAIGEAMAIIMVAGNVANMPGLFRSVRLLNTGIISGMSYAAVGSLYQQALFSIGLVLFLFIMLINVFLNVFIKKRKED